MVKTRDAVRILEHQDRNDSAMRRRVAREMMNLRAARLILDARMKAGLTQKQLAELIGTKQPVIARLEDADYLGHSLSMLARIAIALDQRLDILFLPASRRAHAA